MLNRRALLSAPGASPLVLLAAAPVGRRILAAVERLAEFPFRSKPSRLPDTRELVISRLPYLVVYGIEADNFRSVVMLRLLHGAMFWPLG